MVGMNDGTVWWGVITSLRTRSWIVQAVQSRIFYKSFLRRTISRYNILSCAVCATLPASPSYPASRNTRTQTHTRPHASRTDSANRRYVHRGIKFRFTHFTASFRWKAFKICQDPTTSKMQFFARFDSTAYFFRSKKNLLRHALRPSLMGAFRIFLLQSF